MLAVLLLAVCNPPVTLHVTLTSGTLPAAGQPSPCSQGDPEPVQSRACSLGRQVCPPHPCSHCLSHPVRGANPSDMQKGVFQVVLLPVRLMPVSCSRVSLDPQILAG